MPALLLFVLWPVTEIVLFVLAGDLLGLWPTLGLVLATTALGVFVLRTQGIATMAQMRPTRESFQDPTGPMASSAIRFMAGMFLVLPGFLTDAIGLLLLLPPVRRLIISRISAGVRVMGAGPMPGAGAFTWSRGGPAASQGGFDDIIDGEATEVRPEAKGLPDDSRPPSGWQR